VPIINTNIWVCLITGERAEGRELPPGWFALEGEVFSPRAQQGIAQYVVDHPGIGFKALVDGMKHPPVAEALKAAVPTKRDFSPRTLDELHPEDAASST
jgi:hypothetical protein